MKKLKAIFTIGLFFIIMILGVNSYASNENIQIIKKSNTDYLIYIKDNLSNTFEFAFSNDSGADKATLTYLSAAKDSADSANYIAYIDKYTTEHDYIWVKLSDGTYILEAVELDLAKAIPENELNSIQEATRKINVDTTKTYEEVEEVEGVKKTLILGKIVLLDKGNYEYQIIKTSENSEESKLMDLAKRISKFNNTTDMFTKLEIYNRFNVLYNNMTANLNSANWKKVENNEIIQPKDAENGTEYIVWIKKDTATRATSSETTDVQFLTSKREYKEDKTVEEITTLTEKKVVEAITTKLPVTYDNNIVLVFLGVAVVLIAIVSIRIMFLNKKENK